jgi:crotonobetainyl-CoA:carnitine CoA-transferase CaiB-like acyl-CoA transferase
VEDVANDPQVAHRSMLRDVTHPTAGTIRIADTPVRLSRSETGIAGPPPDMGQHTAGVLEEWLGISGDDVAAFEAAGVVATKGGPDIDRIT